MFKNRKKQMPKNIQEIAIKIQEYMQILEESGQFNGSILVAQDDDIIVSQGYGFANFEHEISNTSETKFRLASITKQFTATAALILQNQGKLELKEKISSYLPGSPVEWEKVTVHHLLNHTSGIPEHTDSLNWNTTGREKHSKQKIIDLFKNKPLNFQPGERFDYSNSGYILLGALIEKVSALSYEEFLNKNIFKPLGMNNTGYDHSQKILKQRASGYEINNDEIIHSGYLDMSVPYASGALYSTVEDIFLWNQSFYSNKILPEDTLDKMITPNPLVANYGYGCIINQKHDCKVIGHAGGIHGFNTIYEHYLEEKLCIVILCNLLQRTSSGEIANTLGAIFFEEGYSIPKKRSSLNLGSSTYQSLIGQYQLSSQIILTIKTDTNCLLVEVTGGREAKFFPESESRFYQQFSDRQIEFSKNDDGKVNQLILLQDGVELKAHKVNT